MNLIKLQIFKKNFCKDKESFLKKLLSSQLNEETFDYLDITVDACRVATKG